MAFNVIQARPTMAAGASVSDAILVPRNCNTVTFFTPNALAGPAGVLGTPQWKIESAVPVNNDADVVQWMNTCAFDVANNEVVPLAFPFTANQALVLPAWYFGSGVIRISTFDVVQPTAVNWTVFFGSFNN